MKLYLVGLGPGCPEMLTPQAQAALEDSTLITGYTVYIDLLQERFAHKRLESTPMRREEERCRMALQAASEGETVSLVCSGDAGVYGLAGLVLELAPQYPPVEIQVVPGITAACAAAAVLGAPLVHDFAVISLSDLLTPLPLIEKRLDAAAAADFVLCLYNPSSKKRADYLRRACDIVLRHQVPETVCGWVKNIGREGQTSRILTLGELRDEQVDMFTTVIIGNSQTKVSAGRMVTPRGYRLGENA